MSWADFLHALKLLVVTLSLRFVGSVSDCLYKLWMWYMNEVKKTEKMVFYILIGCEIQI